MCANANDEIWWCLVTVLLLKESCTVSCETLRGGDK